MRKSIKPNSNSIKQHWLDCERVKRTDVKRTSEHIATMCFGVKVGVSRSRADNSLRSVNNAIYHQIMCTQQAMYTHACRHTYLSIFCWFCVTGSVRHEFSPCVNCDNDDAAPKRHTLVCKHRMRCGIALFIVSVIFRCTRTKHHHVGAR